MNAVTLFIYAKKAEKLARQEQANMTTTRCQRRIGFTKESAACSAFPHQVHGPGQGAGAGECPGVHASVLAVEAATDGAKCPAPRGKRDTGIKGNSSDETRETARGKWGRLARKRRTNKDFSLLLVQSPNTKA